MTVQPQDNAGYPEGQSLHRFVDRRKRVAQIWHSVFLAATVVGVIALLALLYNVINESFGYVAFQNQVEPQKLIHDFYAGVGRPVPEAASTGDITSLAALPKADLLALLTSHLSTGRVRALAAAKPLDQRTEAELAQLADRRSGQTRKLPQRGI